MATGVPVLSACAGVRRADIRQQAVDVTGLELDGVRVLELASLAPSGHNTQPWGINALEPYTWVITSDEQRWLPAVDPDQRETLLSIGAFMENLTVAAECLGYDVELKLLAGTSKDKDVVEAKLKKAHAHCSDDDPIERMKRRRIIRKGYLSREIREDDLRFITGGLETRFHYFPPVSRQGRYLSEGTVEANRRQAYRTEAQEELARWIRWSDAEAGKFRDGLNPEGMEITGFAGWYVRHFFHREDVLGEAFKEATMRSVIGQTERHGGWLVMTSEDSGVEDLVETGRLFQQMSLRLRDRMIAIHPMTQMLEEAPWRNMIASELGLSGHVQFLLRIGYVDRYPDPVTLRRPAHWFVKARTPG
jgi:hypothetical protein